MNDPITMKNAFHELYKQTSYILNVLVFQDYLAGLRL